MSDKDILKTDPKVDYLALEKQRAEALQLQLKQQLKALEAGNKASLRRVVLRYVTEGLYKEASATVDEYMDLKKEYPSAITRGQAHVLHAKELINAIRAKRNFPNLSQLSIAKQQEILDHAIGHFEELKMTLKAIEYLVRDESIKDIRSTVWVLRTLFYSLTTIILASFLSEFMSTLSQPLWLVFNDLSNIGFDFLLKVLPFI